MDHEGADYVEHAQQNVVVAQWNSKNVDTRKTQKKRRPTAGMMGESTAKSESLTKPLILTSATISAALRADLGLGFQYSDWKSALALATACVCFTSC